MSCFHFQNVNVLDIGTDQALSKINLNKIVKMGFHFFV